MAYKFVFCQVCCCLPLGNSVGVPAQYNDISREISNGIYFSTG